MNKILIQLCENASFNSVRGMSADKIANAYLANYIAALVIIKLNDKGGMNLLNDKSHLSLKKISNSMSRPNFWGFIVFNSDNSSLKKIISSSAIDELSKNAGRIVSSRIKKLQTFTTMKDEKINWTDAAYSIKLLKVRFNLSYSKINYLANNIYFWDSLTELEKGNLIYTAFSYLMQSDNESDLLPRLRILSDNKYLTVNSIVSTLGQKINKVFRIFEEEDGGDGGVNTGNNTNSESSDLKMPDGTMSQDIGNLPYKFNKGKIIKRKKRRWIPRKWKDPSLDKNRFGG